MNSTGKRVASQAADRALLPLIPLPLSANGDFGISDAADDCLAGWDLAHRFGEFPITGNVNASSTLELFVPVLIRLPA